MTKPPYRPYDNFIADFFWGLLAVLLGFAVAGLGAWLIKRLLEMA